jgi:hypothetical protein
LDERRAGDAAGGPARPGGLAGQVVAEATVAYEWKTLQRNCAQLLGRGDIKQIWLAGNRGTVGPELVASIPQPGMTLRR